MRIEAWRLVKKKHASDAFSGEGAARAGGRWNSRGVAVVYTSATRSLAALEALVHLSPREPFEFLFIRAEFDDGLAATLDPAFTPVDWRTEPPTSTRLLGDEWAHSLDSPVLAVPSIIIPEESNYLVNPFHPQFHKIIIGEPSRFAFDSRLLI